MSYQEFNTNSISEAMNFICDETKKYITNHKEAGQAQLMAEECINKLLEHADDTANNKICVNIKKFFGSVKINISVKGQKFDFEDSLNFGIDFNQENISTGTAGAISNLLIKSFAGKLHYKHHRGMNYIIITASKSPYTSLYYTGAALILAIITGLVMKNFASESVCTYINDMFLSSVNKIFMNSLKLCAVALVFFSVSSCITNIGNLSDLKKIGGTLTICFILLQILALITGITTFYILKPGADLAINSIDTNNIISGSVSVRDTIINIFPDNLVKPFLNGDMLQLIVLAILLGWAVIKTGTNTFKKFLDECNTIFMQITTAVMKFIPLVVFCSITSLILTMGGKTMRSLIEILIAIEIAFIAISVLLTLIAAFMGRLNPLKILLKSIPTIITSFVTCSSNVAIPDNLKACEKMGVDPKLYTISIPLGTAINKLGSCIQLSFGSLTLAYIYGINVSPLTALSMIFTFLLLGVAAPVVPGGTFISITAVLVMLGCPVEAVALLMSVAPAIDMVCAIVNAFGNTTTTLIAASHEKMINKEIFNS